MSFKKINRRPITTKTVSITSRDGSQDKDKVVKKTESRRSITNRARKSKINMMTGEIKNPKGDHMSSYQSNSSSGKDRRNSLLGSDMSRRREEEMVASSSCNDVVVDPNDIIIGQQSYASSIFE
jgi:hypothetical protein